MSGTVSADNIILEGAYVKAALYGVGTLTELGYTKNPINLNPNESYREVRSAQTKGIVKKIIQDRNVDIDVDLMEVTKANTLLYFNLPDSALSGNTITCDLSTRGDIKLVVVGKNESGYARTWTFRKCEAQSNGAVNVGDTENEQSLPLRVTAKPDPDATTTDEVWTCVDAVA